MPAETSKRVIAVAPLPAEKCAYALARYSRSPDSIRESIEWVRTHDSKKFLESFYFQYGHASIADLGHVVLCFEGISELAATEVEDEALWDGQARSSRYQNFSTSGLVTPGEFDGAEAKVYREAAASLLQGYAKIHSAMLGHLRERLPRPEGMKQEAYERNLAARAFDVARYLLPFGISTGAGQVTSIRTLERQIRRLKTSVYAEVRALGAEIAEACVAPPDCVWDSAIAEPVAPTLAKYVDPDSHMAASRDDLRQWAAQNLPQLPGTPPAGDVDLLRCTDAAAEIAATLLYPVTAQPFRQLYEFARSAGQAMRREIVDTAVRSRSQRDELLRGFRGGQYAFDIVMDIGAYRDLHRHRRCLQYRQEYSSDLGYSTPPALAEAGVEPVYRDVMDRVTTAAAALPAPGSHYLLPFGTRSRFLFKMDFAEAEYIARLRSGVKGHFSYRSIAWQMKEAMERLEPELGRLMQATPPWIEDPLNR